MAKKPKKIRNARRAQKQERVFKAPASFGDWGRVRLLFVAVVFGLAWLALWGRAYQVQLVMGPELAAKAARQHMSAEYVTGERGAILDRKGRLLAKSVTVKSVYGSPREVDDPAAIAHKLAKVLRMSPNTIARKLQGDGHFAWISRKVGDREAAEIKALDLPGVHLTTEFARQYPNRSLAGRLIGFVGLDNQGLEGLEASLERVLAGRKERIVVQRDAAGHTMYPDVPDAEELARGRDVRLTLDLNVQFVAEEALAKAVEKHNAAWGGCIVAHVSTGEILAWAEYPLFNPNSFRDSSPDKWRNRLALDALEPGSTLKPILLAAALQERILDRNSLYFCEEGSWKVDGVTIKDTHSYGWLPAHKVLRYSSNICSAKIGLELGADRYGQYLIDLGFGTKTDLPLPGESNGIMRPPASWRNVETAAASFGQSLAVTLPQLVQAYLCLLNDGVTTPLQLTVDAVKEGDAAHQTQVFKPSVARQVVSIMRDVVQEDGTGSRARIENLAVGGKTGTAQKAGPSGGYGDDYVASFIGFFPAEAPEYLIAVVVDEPAPEHYGGTVAAPAFKEAAVKTLAYMGQLPDAPALASAAHAGAAGNSARHSDGGGKERTHVAESEHVSNNAQQERRSPAAPAIVSGKTPNVVGLSLRKAVELFAQSGASPRLEGAGPCVVRQSPAPGEAWPDTQQQAAERLVLWLGPRES